MKHKFRPTRHGQRLLLLFIPLVVYMASFPQALARSPYPGSSIQALQWRLIGPFRGGRAVAVSGVIGHPQTFYFGGADGGVWKTTDTGKHWRNVSDCCLTTGAIGAIAVAPSDPNVIYVGTGEPFPRGDMATGDGIWKSTDAGHSWTHLGLAATRVISGIVVDPRNPDHVYVAALGHVFGPNPERGIYESHDGGKNWHKLLYLNEHVGAVDLVMDPDNPRILYAAMWRVSRKPWRFSSGGPGSGLYKSTDGGAHWVGLSHNPGMPKGAIGKIGIAVSAAAPNRLYAIIEAKAGGVFRSDNGGATWQRLFHQSELTQRAWYFSRLYADPKNPNRLYAPQVKGLFISNDGGKTFHPRSTPHGDNHVLWINSAHPRIMIVGNDGGAAISRDGGQSWSGENNQPTAQFYHVALDGQFPFHVYGAQQDDTTVDITSRNTRGGGIGVHNWHSVAGGESGFVVPVPGKPWITYGGGYDGSLTRLNTRTGQREFLDPWPDNPMGHAAVDLRYRFQWTYPIVVSRFAPNTIYVGAQYVLESTDGGRQWKRISPDLTRNDKALQVSSGGPITQDNTSVEYYDTIFALAESPLRPNLLWAGTDDGRVWITTDNGKHWRNVTPSGLPAGATISSIEPSHFHAGTVFIASRRYRRDDYRPYLYKTGDYGKHWRRITRGLPDNESSFVVHQDTRDPNLLFAGTLNGVYVSFNGGKNWQSLQRNLPPVAVRDMAIQPQANALVVATHGRAFWVLDNLQPLRELSPQALRAPAFLFTPQTARLTGGYRNSKANAESEGENPPNGVTVFYELRHAPRSGEPVSLSFATAEGRILARFSNLKTPLGKPLTPPKDFYPPHHPHQSGIVKDRAGMNRFVWNLRLPPATPIPGSVLWMGSLTGPRVIPGTYQVTLTVGKTAYTRQFVVAKDPRSSATQADLEARFGLLSKIHSRLNAVDRAILTLRRLRKQILAYQPRLPTDTPAAGQAKSILDETNGIETMLMQTRSHAVEDPLNYPVRLRNKLAALAMVVGASLSRPTDAEYAVWKLLDKKTGNRLQALSKIITGRIAKLNALIKQSGLPPIAARKTTRGR